MQRMSTPVILPFVHAQGDWADIGQQVGATLAPLIERHVEAWMRHVRQETGADRAAILASAGVFQAPIETHAPFLWDELQGMTYTLATCRTGALSVTVQDPHVAAS